MLIALFRSRALDPREPAVAVVGSKDPPGARAHLPRHDADWLRERKGAWICSTALRNINVISLYLYKEVFLFTFLHFNFGASCLQEASEEALPVVYVVPPWRLRGHLRLEGARPPAEWDPKLQALLEGFREAPALRDSRPTSGGARKSILELITHFRMR